MKHARTRADRVRENREAKANSRSKADLETRAYSEPKAAPEARAFTTPEPKADVIAYSEPRSSAEVRADAEAWLNSESKPKAEARLKAAPSVDAEPVAEAKPKTKTKVKTKKKSRGFRRFLLIWIVLLAAFGVYAMIYVNGTLKEMQANSTEQFINTALRKMSDAQIKECFDFNSAEGGDPVKNVRSFFEGGSYTVKQNRKTGVYSIYNGESAVLGVQIKKVKAVNKLGLFNYSILELEGFVPTEEKELYHYEITAPDSCVVSLDGKVVEPTSTESLKNFADAAKYISIPSENYYLLDHFTHDPKISITKDGKAVEFEKSANIEIDSAVEKFETLEEAGCDFKILEFAEKWSRLMTKDLSGNRYGFYNIAAYLIKDSTQYNKAWKWVTSIDITFTSTHTLRNPAFTEQKATNVVKYSPDAVSVDVHLVKHMKIKGSTGNYDDVMDSTVYLIKYNDEWKVVNMRSIADDTANGGQGL